MRSALCLAAIVLLAGCGQGQATWPLPEDAEAWSILQTKSTPDELKRTIKEGATPDGARHLAVMQLFANHVRKGMTAEEIAVVLGDAPWLAEALLREREADRLGIVQSFVDESYFELDLVPPVRRDGPLWRLFPPRSKWHISFVLKGNGNLTVEDARKFLTGAEGAPDGVRLERYTLVMPGDLSMHFGSYIL